MPAKAGRKHASLWMDGMDILIWVWLNIVRIILDVKDGKKHPAVQAGWM
jgi:hypothetical protein